jgi:signal transduction histidine kinase
MRLFIISFFLLVISYGQSTDELSVLKATTLEEGLSAYFKKNDEGVKESILKLKQIYFKDKDSIILAKYYQYKAMYYELKYKADSSFYFYDQSKNISKQINDSLEVGRRLLSMANIQRSVKDFLGSEISSVEALKYLEPIKSYKYLESVYNNLGIVSRNLKDYKSSEKNFSQALSANRKNLKGDRTNTSYLYIINGIGLSYQLQDQHKKALEYFNKGLSYDSIRTKYPLQYALLLENFTYSGIAIGKKDFALDNYNEVLSIRESEKDLSNLSITHNLISDFYKSENKFVKAKYHANKALIYAKQTNNNKRWLEALEMLSDLTKGNESRVYLKEYIKLNDSLFQQERQLKNQFAKIRYETDKTEKENEDLKIENEKTLAEAELQKQRATIALLLSGISIMFLLSSISFFRFRRKKLLFLSQLQKIEAREQERRQIAKSLHDEVAGDLRLLHRKLEKSFLLEEAQKLELVKDNVRNLSHQLSSVSFEDVPFRDQILNLVSDYFSPDFIIKVNGLKEIDWSEANKSIKRLLYLSLRECIQNCQKYAEASKMTINFSIHKKSVFLDVADNGKGFDTATQKKGIGLLNLQERVQDLNGTLTIDSEVGKGTKIIIQTPLNA